VHVALPSLPQPRLSGGVRRRRAQGKALIERRAIAPLIFETTKSNSAARSDCDARGVMSAGRTHRAELHGRQITQLECGVLEADVLAVARREIYAAFRSRYGE
jgi:hypothetical protein